MNHTNFDPLHVDEMPLDRLAIGTNLAVAPDFAARPAEFLNKLGLAFLDIDPKPATKHRPFTLYVELLSKDSIKLKVVEDVPGKSRLIGIKFCAGKLRYFHNGRILETREAIEAFGLVCQTIQPLLERPSDVSRIIPGCHPKSPSFWREIEIPMHLYDPEEKLLAVLRNIRHPKLRKEATHYEGESITLGTRRSVMMINVYRKDLEMESDLKRFSVTDAPQVLRVEVTLKGPRLLEYLGSKENTHLIGGQLRLVRFAAEDLYRAHRTVVTELGGVANVQVAGDLPGNEKFGRFMGLMSHRYGESIAALLQLYDHRFKPGPATLSRMRTAALDEVSRIPSDIPNLFSEWNYQNQPCIAVPQLEGDPGEPKVSPDLLIDIEKVYGRRPAITSDH